MKTPQQKGDESTRLIKTLLETQSYAEAGVTVAGALFAIMLEFDLPRTETLEDVGRFFAGMYVAENKEQA